jgi:hypothetical protein
MAVSLDESVEKKILSRYANHLNVLKKMGSYQLSKKITINDLGNKKEEVKAITQKCYRDMEDDVYLKVSSRIPKVSAIEYLCLVSFQYLLYLLRKEIYDPSGKRKTNSQNSALKLLNDYGIKFQAKGKIKDELELEAIKQIMFLNICIKNRFDAKNMIRGFHRNELLFITGQSVNAVGFTTFYDSEISRLAFFKLINVLNFYECEMDNFKVMIYQLDKNHKIDKDKVLEKRENFGYWEMHFQDMVENMVITKPLEIHYELHNMNNNKRLKRN